MVDPLPDTPDARHPRRTVVSWFLSTSLGALVVAVLYPVIRFLDPPAEAQSDVGQVDVGPVNAPEFRDKGYTIIRMGGDPVIVVKAGERDFRAFSATCTHLACIVEYRRDLELIWCNCHDGRFNLQGQVVGGPPPKPLPQYAVNLVPADGTEKVVVSRSRT